ncbi:MAG: hypothetical protein GZ088_09580 [Acidipila sp.]|nr:hypothetical protein [Acidipila sp.]
MIQNILAQIGHSLILRESTKFDIAPTPVMSLDIETFGANKLPGDSAYSTMHGVAGISIGNMRGDAAYLVVNDGKDYDASPIHMAMTAVNRILHQDGVTTVLVHYGKFDLGFLVKRGLQLAGLRVIDTWMLRNIKCCGVYSTGKLKQIMRDKFKISTDTEKEKDDWMAANNTQDYGDVPIEIMGKYACDDPRYTMLAFLSEANVSQTDWKNHDLYMANTMHVIRAEERGTYANIALLKKRLEICATATAKKKDELKELLGASEVDLEDETAIMRYLHDKNLHSAPREKYGEMVYDFDRDFLLSVDHPVSNTFYWYHRYRTFTQCFSGARGEMGARIFFDTTGGGFHLQHLLSTFSRGGIPQCKQPDLSDRLAPLTNEIREVFVPRPDHELVVCRAVDLQVMLLAFYSNNLELQNAVRMNAADGTNILPLLAKGCGLTHEATSLLLRQALEGSGFERLTQRLTAAKVKGVGDKKTLYNWRDKFVNSIAGFPVMKQSLEASLKSTGGVCDRMGRVLNVPQDSLYRAHAILINSSNGSILSFYLDIFCKVAAATGAHLVLAHEKEFVFEVPKGNEKFAQACRAVVQQRLINPHPAWEIRCIPSTMSDPGHWRSHTPDAHEVANLEK